MPSHIHVPIYVCHVCLNVRWRWWCVRMLLFHRICIYDEIQTRHGQLRTHHIYSPKCIQYHEMSWNGMLLNLIFSLYRTFAVTLLLRFLCMAYEEYTKPKKKKRMWTCLKAKCSPMLIVKPAKITQPINVRVTWHIWKKKSSWWSRNGFILSIFFFAVQLNWMDSGDKSLGFMQWVFWFASFFSYSHKSEGKNNRALHF